MLKNSDQFVSGCPMPLFARASLLALTLLTTAACATTEPVREIPKGSAKAKPVVVIPTGCDELIKDVVYEPIAEGDDMSYRAKERGALLDEVALGNSEAKGCLKTQREAFAKRKAKR